MKLAIFSGTIKGKRFFDWYTDEDIEANEVDYIQDAKFFYELSEAEKEELMKEITSDFDSFCDCLDNLTVSDQHRVLHGLYRNDLERDLLSSAVEEKAEEMVKDKWVDEKLGELEKRYKEIADV